MKKIVKKSGIDTDKSQKKSLDGFEVLDIGFTKNLKGGCGNSDADRMCSSWCPTYSCSHDGTCGSGYFDW